MEFRCANAIRNLKWALSCSILLLGVSCSEDEVGPEPVAERPTEPETSEDALPLVAIRTNSNTIVDEPKVDADMTVIFDGQEDYNGRIGIEFRGASSQMFPKKSYGLETRDTNNEDLNVSVLGYPEEEDWILYGPYSDKSLVRNKLIYDLARDMDRYASRTLFVDLEIDNSYFGVYVFMEKLKRANGRIDIDKLTPDENSGEDVTGGYILKIDKLAGTNLGSGYDQQNSFTSTYPPLNAANGQRTYFLYEEPDAEDITDEQKAYISGYVSQFEDALMSENFADADAGYRAFIDTESFIDFFLLNELANNVDGYRLSTYMYKDKNEKLAMGPIWDFNLAFGNADYCSGGESNVWAYKFNERCPDDRWLVPFWWDRFLQDPAFVSQLKERWEELRGNTFSEGQILSRIDAYVDEMEKTGSIDANFQAWPVLGLYVWPNNFIGQTYAEENNYLKSWIGERLAWLDTSIQGL